MHLFEWIIPEVHAAPVYTREYSVELKS